jgi:hypothetical protein
MAEAWQAATVYYNMSDGSTGWGNFYYDFSVQALRTDFFPICPFLQLFDAGVDANYIPCSVLFYKGIVRILNLTLLTAFRIIMYILMFKFVANTHFLFGIQNGYAMVTQLLVDTQILMELILSSGRYCKIFISI